MYCVPPRPWPGSAERDDGCDSDVDCPHQITSPVQPSLSTLCSAFCIHHHLRLCVQRPALPPPARHTALPPFGPRRRRVSAQPPHLQQGGGGGCRLLGEKVEVKNDCSPCTVWNSCRSMCLSSSEKWSNSTVAMEYWEQGSPISSHTYDHARTANTLPMTTPGRLIHYL